MGGREGLLIQLLKHSQTGYIQRKLVKVYGRFNVHYDLVVRNNWIETLYQFIYGEDGMDSFICRRSTIIIITEMESMN